MNEGEENDEKEEGGAIEILVDTLGGKENNDNYIVYPRGDDFLNVVPVLDMTRASC